MGAHRIAVGGLPQSGDTATTAMAALASAAIRTVTTLGPSAPRWSCRRAGISCSHQSARTSARRLPASVGRSSGEGTLSLRLSTGGPSLEADLDAFLKVEASGWKTRAGTAILSRETDQCLYREFAHAGRAGVVDGCTCSTRRRAPGGRFGCRDRGRGLLLKTGFDEAYGVLLSRRRAPCRRSAGVDRGGPALLRHARRPRPLQTQLDVDRESPGQHVGVPRPPGSPGIRVSEAAPPGAQGGQDEAAEGRSMNALSAKLDHRRRQLRSLLDVARWLGPRDFVRVASQTGNAPQLDGAVRNQVYLAIWRDAASELRVACEELSDGFVEVRSGDTRLRLRQQLIPTEDPVALQLALHRHLVHGLLVDAGLPAPQHVQFIRPTPRLRSRSCGPGADALWSSRRVAPPAGTARRAGSGPRRSWIWPRD